MSMLAEEPVILCKGGTPALTAAEQQALLPLVPSWSVVEDNGIQQLQRSFTFGNFANALQFANQVGASAEAANHHPALLVEWGKVSVRWWTHTIHGLHRNDFIMAARCDRLYLPPAVS